jgi:acyl carrier protein
MLNKIASILSEHQGIDINDIKPDSHLINDLSLNSFDVVELMCVFEDELGVEIPDNQIRQFRVVGDIVEYIEKQLKA